MIEPITAAWIRNPSDQHAAELGYRVDLARGAFVIWWIERFCKLYQGEQAGEPLILHGCHDCGTVRSERPIWDEETQAEAIDRAERFNACVAAGHRIDWQYECVIRLFSWVRFSRRWQREIRRFRQASIWVAKKNKKSPTEAAIGLYLMMGDGEPGAGVAFAAKDGMQARGVVGEHAIKMIESSPELSAECKINRNLLRISHQPSGSMLQPLSSGNKRQQEAKEGLNLNGLLIDETHVVDEEFIGRLSRAGISRSEYLQIECSTAGDNPTGYGKQRFDIAQDVLAGRVQRPDFFAAIYAAPQDLREADLVADPLKYARMANPALGHTVDAEEFLADLQQSRQKLGDFARFLMYRLNVWQASGKPWLDMVAWSRCKHPRPLSDLIGRPCAAGLDLAKTRDTCALVLCFWIAEEEAYYLLSFFWMPRQRAEVLKDKVPYLDWASDNWLTLTDGDIADYNVVHRGIAAQKLAHSIGRLVFDDMYAHQLVQRLVDEDRIFLIDETISFSQTITTFAGPTDEFEGLVKSEKLQHDGNPLLTWQAGNTTIATDRNANKRPIKPKPGDVKTIDGIVAAIMAVWGVEPLKRGSIYDNAGIQVI